LWRGESVESAREELGIFFNNAPIGELLDLYEDEEAPFDEWVMETYPSIYRREYSEDVGPAVNGN